MRIELDDGSVILDHNDLFLHQEVTTTPVYSESGVILYFDHIVHVRQVNALLRRGPGADGNSKTRLYPSQG